MDEKGNTNLTRNLMEANEIRMMGKNKAIILAGGEKPILADLVPYYDRIWLKLRANLKPPVMVGVGMRMTMHYVE
jgi:type IV secretory pathway TraG/TraD family ATPase VirD4